MSKIDRLNVKVEKLLSRAVQEVMEVVRETVAEYQEKTLRTHKENQSLKRKLQELQDKLGHESKSPSPLKSISGCQPSEVKQELSENSDLNNILHPPEQYDNLQSEEPFVPMTKDTFHDHHHGNGYENHSALGTEALLEDESPKSEADFAFLSNEIKTEAKSEENLIIKNHFQEDALPGVGTNEELYIAPNTSQIPTPVDLHESTNLSQGAGKIQRHYFCSFCSRTFKHAGDFKKHYRVHTGEKPYSCQFCGKGFVQSGCLKIHLRSHTGERPYRCRRCGRSFTHSGNMKKHEQTCNG